VIVREVETRLVEVTVVVPATSAPSATPTPSFTPTPVPNPGGTVANATRTSVASTHSPTNADGVPVDNRSNLSLFLNYGPADLTLRAVILLSCIGMGASLGFIVARLRP
jgi:hypothetical protein